MGFWLNQPAFVAVFDITPAWDWDMAWAQHTLDFSAPGASTTVSFTGLDATEWGPALDSMSVDLVSAGVPSERTLAFAAVSPDRVRTSGRMAFTLPAAASGRLAVYDVQGRELARLVDGALDAGPHALEFSPRTWGARPGLYLAVLRIGQRTLVRRFTVLD